MHPAESALNDVDIDVLDDDEAELLDSKSTTDGIPLSDGLSPACSSLGISTSPQSSSNNSTSNVAVLDNGPPAHGQPLKDSPRGSAPKSTVVALCGRCSHKEDFNAHASGCKKQNRYNSTVECPRCTCVVVTRNQARNHSVLCFAGEKGLTVSQRRNKCHPKRLMIHHDAPVHLHRCRHCRFWRSIDINVLHVHEVLCFGSGCITPAPVLPSGADFFQQGRFVLAPSLCHDLMRVFNTHDQLRSSGRLRYLLQLADRGLTNQLPPSFRQLPPGEARGCFNQGVSPPPFLKMKHSARKVTASPDALTITAVVPGPKFVPESNKRKADGKLVCITTKEHQKVPIDRPGRFRRSRARDTGPEVTVRHGDGRRDVALGMGELSPQCVPVRDVTVESRLYVTANEAAELFRAKKARAPTNDVNQLAACQKADKERFKILVDNWHWVDAHGRSISPRREHMQTIRKPDPSMTGTFINIMAQEPPVTVSVSGHLPSGWGYVCTPDGKEHLSYKSTPGDLTPVPKAATDLSFYVIFFLSQLANGSRPPVGPLHTACQLSRYDKAEYRAAGVKSSMWMTKG